MFVAKVESQVISRNSKLCKLNLKFLLHKSCTLCNGKHQIALEYLHDLLSLILVFFTQLL